MNTTTEEISKLRLPFFITYIVVGCLFLLLHLRLIMIIHFTMSLSKLAAYRVIQHASIACFINITTQVIAVAFTLSQNDMNYTTNTINGAIFQGSWAVEYPMLLILAVNRLLSIALPILVNQLCDLRLANAVVVLCWSFGVFNAILCLSGQVQTYWIASAPGFAFTDGTFLAQFLFYMDLYFAEFVVFSSLVCYIFIFIILIVKRDSMKYIKVEMPLILHFGTIFILTAVVLYLWHHPVGESDLYGHIFNLAVLLRFCPSPILAILTNKSIRERFFRHKIVEATMTVQASKRTES